MTNSSVDIHATGFWAVHTPAGEAVTETFDPTGYGARASMVREKSLIWSQRLAQGYSLVRYLPQVVEVKTTTDPVIRKGVTGAEFWMTSLGYAESEIAPDMPIIPTTLHGAVERTIEAVELALTAAGFNITDPALKDCLQTALESMANTVD